jgi:disulfide bond formation protein DsbB
MNSFTMFCFIMLLLGLLTAAQARFVAIAAGFTSAAAVLGLCFSGALLPAQKVIIEPPRFTKKCSLAPTTYSFNFHNELKLKASNECSACLFNATSVCASACFALALTPVCLLCCFCVLLTSDN